MPAAFKFKKILPYFFPIAMTLLIFALVGMIIALRYDPLANFHIADGSGGVVYGGDFRANYFAAKRLSSNDSLYLVDRQILKFKEELTANSGYGSYVYAPFSSYFFWPLAQLPLYQSYVFSVILGLVFFLLSLFFLSRSMIDRERYLAIFLPSALFSFPLWALIERGQSDLFILSFLVACYYFFRTKRYALSGLALAIAASFKVTPLIFLPYFYFKNRKIFYYSVSFLAISVLLFGVQNFVEFISSLRNFAGGLSTTYINLGWFGFFYNKFTFRVLSPQTAHLLYVVLILVLFAAVLYFLRQKLKKSTNDTVLLMEFGVLTAIMMMIPTVSFVYHAVHLLFIFSAYWNLRLLKQFSLPKLLLLDVLIFLILSPLALFHAFTVTPLSYIFSLRPALLTVFIITIIGSYLKLDIAQLDKAL